MRNRVFEDRRFQLGLVDAFLIDELFQLAFGDEIEASALRVSPMTIVFYGLTYALSVTRLA